MSSDGRPMVGTKAVAPSAAEPVAAAPEAVCDKMTAEDLALLRQMRGLVERLSASAPRAVPPEEAAAAEASLARTAAAVESQAQAAHVTDTLPPASAPVAEKKSMPQALIRFWEDFDDGVPKAKHIVELAKEHGFYIRRDGMPQVGRKLEFIHTITKLYEDNPELVELAFEIVADAWPDPTVEIIAVAFTGISELLCKHTNAFSVPVNLITLNNVLMETTPTALRNAARERHGPDESNTGPKAAMLLKERYNAYCSKHHIGSLPFHVKD